MSSASPAADPPNGKRKRQPSKNSSNDTDELQGEDEAIAPRPPKKKRPPPAPPSDDASAADADDDDDAPIKHRKDVTVPDYPFAPSLQQDLDYKDEQGLVDYFWEWALQKSGSFMSKVGIKPGRGGGTKGKRAMKLAAWELENRVQRRGSKRALPRPQSPGSVDARVRKRSSSRRRRRRQTTPSTPSPARRRGGPRRRSKGGKGIGDHIVLPDYSDDELDVGYTRHRSSSSLRRQNLNTYYYQGKIRKVSEEEPEVIPRGVWPERYPNHWEVPIWGRKKKPAKKDQGDYMGHPIRGMDVVDGPLGYDAMMKCREWGRLGWQTGWISRLRAETEARRMNMRVAKDDAGVERIDAFIYRRRLRRMEGRDPMGKIDVEAYDRTVMLLNYELEAAVRRFGGDIITQMQMLGSELRNLIHEGESGLSGNDDKEFVDPGVGPGYQVIDVSGEAGRPGSQDLEALWYENEDQRMTGIGQGGQYEQSSLESEAL